MNGIRRRLTGGGRGDAGFTLIELLVVIIIIAILAAIGIPTFLGQRQHAQDAAAYTLVRNALTAVQTAWVETSDYTALTAAVLGPIETSINWVQGTGDVVVIGGVPSIDGSVVADANLHQVVFFAESSSVMDVASRSASGNWFGIQVDSQDLTQTGYVKVKVVDGTGSMGW
jgi:prepilin-type N-terminal cleavage/methylation domain-containing protein